MVDVFGILSQSHFDGQRRFYNHFVDATPKGLYCRHLSANGVGTAGAGDYCRHAAFQRLPEATVHGVQGIHSPQLGGNGIGFLVAVIAFKGQTILPHSQMGVGVNKAGVHVCALQIDPFFSRLFRADSHGA